MYVWRLCQGSSVWFLWSVCVHVSIDGGNLQPCACVHQDVRDEVTGEVSLTFRHLMKQTDWMFMSSGYAHSQDAGTLPFILRLKQQ